MMVSFFDMVFLEKTAQNYYGVRATGLQIFLSLRDKPTVDTVMKRILLPILLGLCALPLCARTFYMAPNGRDNAAGTLRAPFATLPAAYARMSPGDTLYFRAGTYKVTDDQVMKTEGLYAYVFALEKGGTAAHRTCFMGYPGERPVFDFSALQLDGKHRFAGFYLGADYLHLRNFEIVGLPVRIKGHTQSECVSARKGSHCIVENLSMHDNMAIGFYQTAGSYNLVLNCDAYNNYDNYSEGAYGGNVDGFGFHMANPWEVGNVIRGCRAWRNSDDGYDLIHCAAPVEIDHCWAFYNGFQPTADPRDNETFERAGDGNGFKSGGWALGAGPTRCPPICPSHYIHHSVAYRNKVNGFDSNYHLAGNRWENNSAAMNPRDFNMVNRKGPGAGENQRVPGYDHILTANLSWHTGGEDLALCDETKCTLRDNEFGTISVEEGAAMFVSTDPMDLYLPRDPEGNLPEMPFLRAKAGTRLQENQIGWAW